ncbi:MAG: Hsp20/alpha crystallin family protein [Candidatus Buchananbacteria bacterium]
MAIVRWTPSIEPWDEIDKAWDNMLTWPRLEAFVPAVNVYQTKDCVMVETALAGINPDKVDIAIENGILTIKGQQEKKSEVEEKNYYRKEIRTGSFHRTIALPTSVIGEKAEAVFDKGLLTIKIPKAVEAKLKSIKIKVNKK